jgi:hypothetical protein
MSTSTIVLVVVLAAVAVLAIAAWVAITTRRRAMLRERFGPEYDRTVSDADSRRAAERDLRDRAGRRDDLTVIPLSDTAATRYQEQWETVQRDFVDTPVVAVTQAHEIVTAVMRERGYPTADDDERVSLLSVDHADVINRYREACTIEARSQQNQASTEDLRQAMTHYRALFERLVDERESVTASDR